MTLLKWRSELTCDGAAPVGGASRRPAKTGHWTSRNRRLEAVIRDVRYHLHMANKDFYEFFLPSTIPDRKSAARAVAAGFFAGCIMLCVFAVISVSLFVRHESTSMWSVASTATIVMIVVTVGTWKRILVAPLVGLAVASLAIAWEISRGKIAAIVLIIPLMGGFWTAARGIAALKQLRRQASIQETQG